MNDPLFAKKFRIKTPIKYLYDVEVEKGKKKLFEIRWEKAYKRADDDLSDTRRRAFEVYFRRFKREGDDSFYTKRLAIRYLGSKVGYGVFSKESIAPYLTLGHYAGILRPDQEIDEKNDSTFSFGDFPLFSIDAKKAGNWVRFMNHSELRDPKTNVVAWEYYTEEFPYILVTAGSRGIKKGEQLLYSYGDKYWHENLFKQF